MQTFDDAGPRETGAVQHFYDVLIEVDIESVQQMQFNFAIETSRRQFA